MSSFWSLGGIGLAFGYGLNHIIAHTINHGGDATDPRTLFTMAVTIQAVKAGIAIMSGYGYLPGGITRTLMKPLETPHPNQTREPPFPAKPNLESRKPNHPTPDLGSLPRLLLTIAGSLDPRLGEERTDLAIFRSGASSGTRTALFDLAKNSMRRGWDNVHPKRAVFFHNPPESCRRAKPTQGASNR